MFYFSGMNKRSAKSSAAVRMMEVLRNLKEGENENMVGFLLKIVLCIEL